MIPQTAKPHNTSTTISFPARPQTWPTVRSTVLACLAALLLSSTALASPTGAYSNTADARIEAMKAHPRGPFSRIRWFCNDGAILAPGAGACDPHGGGAQHGEWSPATMALRAAGFRIATVFADMDIDGLLAMPRVDAVIAQLLIERYLQRVDNGWIFRGARYYRGALQEEQERQQARALLLKMAHGDYWITGRFLAWRSLAAQLPHGKDTPSALRVRQNSSMLLERDPNFVTLKNKIHNSPAASDAERVLAYASQHPDATLRVEFEQLAQDINALYAIDVAAILSDLLDDGGAYDTDLRAELQAALTGLGASDAAANRLRASARMLQAIRGALQRIDTPAVRLQLLDASIAIEAEHFAAASELASAGRPLSRQQGLDLLAVSSDALYGVGLISGRQHGALKTTLAALDATAQNLSLYRDHIDYLALAPGWSDRQLNFVFGTGMAKLGQIEPLARLFIQDQLRGSPMFFYAGLIDRLLRDVNQLADVKHQLFDATVGVGLRALNPGIARGVLRDGRNLRPDQFQSDGIYLLPETIAELPPVAGIITAGSGNPLSHVQLLARNLGIPNVSVADALLDDLGAQQGSPVLLAVSAAGTVHLRADDAAFDALFKGPGERPEFLIEANLDKLNLTSREILGLNELRADDSGRTVGPKAAKLGELKAHYPGAVANGLALPFGIFRALLDKPAPSGSVPMFEHVVSRYRALEALPAESSSRIEQTEQLRAQIERWIGDQMLAGEVKQQLRDKITALLGPDGTFGVFVRSDTNVEDLPGFTGAGLNLTVANVVGVDNIITAITRVWASPFTARAFSWRQALMRQPEHVYPAVLLLESVNASKSGVLVTQDIDSGNRDWISVAVNEGVGGAVDGQSAESLRIHLDSGEVRLLAQASAPLRRQIAASGGVAKLPASGADAVLNKEEITQLIKFSRALPAQFPAIVDATGAVAPADVEFGFENGKLRLFQIRPFLDNTAARSNQYLLGMDASADASRDRQIDLHAPLP